MRPTFIVGLLAICLLTTFTACQSTYFAAWEKLGYHKRDILVSRVQKAKDGQEAANVPRGRLWIRPVNVLAKGVGLASLNKADRIADLVKILARVYSDESSGRAILLARIRLGFSAGWIQPRSLTEVAFNREEVLGLLDRCWKLSL